MGRYWLRNEADRLKISRSGAPDRKADRKRFCGSLNIKNAERKLFEPPKPAECDDKHHVCELRNLYRPGNDDK